jgi:phage gp29-like protein
MATKKTIPAELAAEFASTGDGRDITRPWVTELQQAKDPRLSGSVDWGAYDRIRKDDQVKSCLEQRIAAVVSADWDVLPGDDTDPRSIAAADAFKAMLARLAWDRVTKKMLWAPFHGYAVAEIIWDTELRDGLVQFKRIHVRHARRFRFDKNGQLRLLTAKTPRGEVVPEYKFWLVTSGGTDDDEPYGEGLADWLYWPTVFKRNGVRFWNVFLDKFGSPTKVATYRRSATPTEVSKVTELLRAASNDSGIAVPEGFVISLLEAARSGSASYKDMCTYMDEAIAKIILSQTMTTQDGSSFSQAQVHAGVKLEIVKADADLLSDSFNEGPARWWSELNFGADVAPPQLVRLVEEEADLKLLAETDEILSRTGWERSDESFTDTYGDGYQRKVAPEPVASPSASLAAPPDAPAQNDNLPVEAPKNADKSAVSFSELVSGDVVDQIAADLLAEHGWKPLSAQLSAVLRAIRESDTPEQLDEALLNTLQPSERETLTQILARATFAARIGAEAGLSCISCV